VKYQTAKGFWRH